MQAGGSMVDVSIRVADMCDRDRIFELLREAAVWLRDRGVDYWQNWHAPPPLHVAWIEDGITAGQFRIVERDGQAIACFRLQDSDELFWRARDEPSVYVHSLTVDRALAGRGIGSLVLARVGEQAVVGGAHFMRLCCGISADGLRRYYESQGFGQVGEIIVDGESLVLYEKSLVRPDLQPAHQAGAADAREARTVGRRRTWALVFAVAAGLLMCGCMSTVFLVLTGIIAEPVTVIEEILRVIHALVGG